MYAFFSEMAEEWLQFVVDCRRGKEHNYNCSAYYEPSYVIARAYYNGGF